MQAPLKRVDPVKESRFLLKQLRRIVLDVAPYRGVLSVTFPAEAAAQGQGGMLRFTSDRRRIPRGLVSSFQSIDDPRAGVTLLNLLVSFYKEFLDYDDDIVVTLHEAEARDPLVAVFGSHKVYLEFGGIGAMEYLPT